MTVAIPSQIQTDWREILAHGLRSETLLSQRRLFEELNPQAMGTPFMEQRRGRPQKEAAVLIPIIDRHDGPSVLFQLRTSDMPSHAGQISFPGGRVHDSDASRLVTALRETEEETGIPQAKVDVIGIMGEHFGGQGYRVSPVIGRIPEDVRFTPCDREVEELFEVPLAFLVDMENHIPEKHMFDKVEYNMFAVPYGKWRIWGLTAGIVHSLARAWHEGLKR